MSACYTKPETKCTEKGVSKNQTRHRARISTRWHFAFALCCCSNETRAPIANPPNTAQQQGTPNHFPKLHPGLCCSVGMWWGTDSHADRQTNRQTHRRAWPLYILRRLQIMWNVIKSIILTIKLWQLLLINSSKLVW